MSQGHRNCRVYSHILSLQVDNVWLTHVYKQAAMSPFHSLPRPCPTFLSQLSSCDTQGAKQTAVTCLSASSCSSQTSCPSSCHRLPWPRQHRRSQTARGKAEWPKLAASRAKLSRQKWLVLAENALVMSTSKLYKGECLMGCSDEHE